MNMLDITEKMKENFTRNELDFFIEQIEHDPHYSISCLKSLDLEEQIALDFATFVKEKISMYGEDYLCQPDFFKYQREFETFIVKLSL